MSGKTLHFSDADFRTEVLESTEPVLVDFWAEWCGPCHALTPTIDALAEQFEGTAKVGKVNIDESPEMAAAYQVRSIPTVIVFQHGEVVERLVGLQSRSEYERVINAATKSASA